MSDDATSTSPAPGSPSSRQLRSLQQALAAVDLPFAVEGASQARTSKQELLDQLEDYLLPRLAQIDAPLLVVLGGSTGAGKSTITNSLVGVEVSTPGVLRPTTRTPVLVCHPDDEPWFTDGGVLPELPRSTGDRPSGAGLHLVTATSMTPGLAILDSPDIDSIEVANHDLAGQLLGAADLWLFVTTAARYADAVPWEYLARARERSIALALVINRLPDGAGETVIPHLVEMMDGHGLEAAHIFAIHEGQLTDGRIGAEVDQVRAWLANLAADEAGRRELVLGSIDGALASIPARVDRIATAVEDQARIGEGLAIVADQHYRSALDRVDSQLASGEVLRGEVLQQWKEIVGTGELMNMLQQGVTRVRDSIKSIFTGGGPDESAFRGEMRSNVGLVVREAADRAALETVEAWESLPGGREALDDAGRGIDRATADVTDRVDAQVEEWQHGVFELVRELAGPKLNMARALSFGINSVGLAAMFAVFSSTGGVTGGEAAVAGGTAAVSQAILSAIFGEQALRDLIALARDDLHARTAAILAHDRQRFDALISATGLLDAAAELRKASSELELARS